MLQESHEQVIVNRLVLQLSHFIFHGGFQWIVTASWRKTFQKLFLIHALNFVQFFDFPRKFRPKLDRIDTYAPACFSKRTRVFISGRWVAVCEEFVCHSVKHVIFSVQ